MGLQNRLRKILKEGYMAFGATIHIPAPALVEILGKLGYDFTMIDTEHGQYDIETAGGLIRTAQGVNLTPIVRVLKNDKGLISKVLDFGAQGVVIPHVSTKEDAIKAVEACKYGPRGRGACPLVRSVDYGIADWQEYQEIANRETMVFLLIEDLEGAKNIENILTVKGIDVVFIGPFDMSVSAGYKGNVGHPEILKNLDRVISVCNERNIPVMHTLACGPDIDAWVKKGVRLILQGADSMIFTRACRSFLESVSHLRIRKQ